MMDFGVCGHFLLFLQIQVTGSILMLVEVLCQVRFVCSSLMDDLDWVVLGFINVGLRGSQVYCSGALLLDLVHLVLIDVCLC
jgi:hypothetical protein